MHAYQNSIQPIHTDGQIWSRVRIPKGIKGNDQMQLIDAITNTKRRTAKWMTATKETLVDFLSKRKAIEICEMVNRMTANGN